MPEGRQLQMSLSDISYPDGTAWRCEWCYQVVLDGQPCPNHPDQPVMRVNRRIKFGDGDDDVRDVVVEYR